MQTLLSTIGCYVHYLEYLEWGQHYIDQDLSCTGETRGWRSLDIVTKVPNKKGKLLLICIYYYCYSLSCLGKIC